MKVRFTPRARRDMAEIHDWIALRNPAAARRVEDYVREVSRGLEDFPMVGALTDLAQVRRLPLVRYPYTIYYRVDEFSETVDILRLVHSARVQGTGKLPSDRN